MASMDMDVSVNIKPFFEGQAVTASSLNSIVERINQLCPAVAVIRCKHCGQWGARFCECVKCGAPIE